MVKSWDLKPQKNLRLNSGTIFGCATSECPSFHIYKTQVVTVPSSSKTVMNKRRKKKRM